MRMELNGTYKTVVAETGIVPERIYARCSSLTAFTYDPPRRAPRVGQKPIRKKRATK
jgi:hypothetical protein